MDPNNAQNDTAKVPDSLPKDMDPEIWQLLTPLQRDHVAKLEEEPKTKYNIQRTLVPLSGIMNLPFYWSDDMSVAERARLVGRSGAGSYLIRRGTDISYPGFFIVTLCHNCFDETCPHPKHIHVEDIFLEIIKCANFTNRELVSESCIFTIPFEPWAACVYKSFESAMNDIKDHFKLNKQIKRKQPLTLQEACRIAIVDNARNYEQLIEMKDYPTPLKTYLTQFAILTVKPEGASIRAFQFFDILKLLYNMNSDDANSLPLPN